MAAGRTNPLPRAAGPGGLRAILRKAYLFTYLRGWLVWSSYRAQVGLTIVGWLVPVFVFFLVAVFLGAAGSSISALDGSSYIAFFVVGLAFQGFVSNLVGMLAQRIRSEQMMGTLELVFLSPTNPGAVLIYSSLFGVVLNLFSAVAIMGVGVGLLGVQLSLNLPTVIVATILLAVSSTGLSLVAAAFILWTKQGNPVALFFSTFTQFFAGVLFPVAVLPASIQWLAYSIPLTFGLDALRSGLLAGGSLVSVAPSLAYMALYALITIPVGLLLFRWVLNRTKDEGTIATY
ncbi:ABC-2 type transporter [mine drainage metagenome]|uniref:ABC-2 type transporter n=2 Tax=mine drainage metagenome TaxID=410659 RepID=T1B4C5_9ZZZZ